MNGKGDSPRKKSVSEETWSTNWERIFRKVGVRIEIDLGDGKKEEGYIIRRHSIDNYEVWAEEQKRTLFLCQNEFKELDR